jgi:hypothetical protein
MRIWEELSIARGLWVGLRSSLSAATVKVSWDCFCSYEKEFNERSRFTGGEPT